MTAWKAGGIPALFCAFTLGLHGGCGAPTPPAPVRPTEVAVSSGGEGCLTRECHRAVLSGPNLHLPAKDMNCGLCHRRNDRNHPDGTWWEFDRVAWGGRVFCFDCHGESDPKPSFTHRPYEAGLCHECHESHGSTIRPLLKRDVNGLCLYCHRDLAARLERGRITHGAVKEETCGNVA